MCKTLSILVTLLIMIAGVTLIGCDGNDNEMEDHSWDMARSDQDISTEDEEATPIWRPQPSEQQTESATEDPSPDELQESEKRTGPRITPTPQDSEVEIVPPDESHPAAANPTATPENVSAEDTEMQNDNDDGKIDDDGGKTDNGEGEGGNGDMEDDEGGDDEERDENDDDTEDEYEDDETEENNE